MKISTFFYTLRQGLKNIWRNKMFSLASIATMTACIFLFGVFFSILINFTNMVKEAEKDVPMTVYFNEGTSKSKIDNLKKQIKNKSGVLSVKYVSAEEAWESFKSDYFSNDPELAESFNEDNPLANSDHFDVYVKKIEEQSEIVSWVETLKGVRKVQVSQVAANMLSNFNVLIGYASIGIIVLLLAVSIFLISNTITIGISVRKEEIAIMKYIGATDFFVRAPFVWEGLIIGLLGAAIPLTIIYFAYTEAVKFVSNRFAILSGIIDFLPVKSVYAYLLPAGLMLGIGIGFLGSYITTRKHIRV